MDLSAQTEAAATTEVGSVERGRLLQEWSNRLAEHVKGNPDAEAAADVFWAILSFIWTHDHRGACHDTSAIAHVLLAELGQSPVLYIGEVKPPRPGYFDHSWVEISGKIFDPAVSLPSLDPSSRYASGPVFAGIDLSTNQPTAVSYDYASDEGLVNPANIIALKDLSSYKVFQSRAPVNGALIPEQRLLWPLAARIAEGVGLPVTPGELEAKYGSVRRVFRGT